MRILFLTNFYPPFELGGQGQSCEQVVAGLRARGHETLVLTSMHGSDNVPAEADGVRRSLYLEMDMTPWRHSRIFFTERKQRQRRSRERLAQALAEFQPDLVFIWGMWNMDRSLAALAEAERPGRVVYRFAEYWPTLPSQHVFYWRARGRRWYSRPLKWALGRVALGLLALEPEPPALKFEHAISVSAATRDVLRKAGVPLKDVRVIHTGLDTGRFSARKPDQGETNGSQRLKLLYAGRLSASKGVETAIKAVAELVGGRGMREVSLAIAGSGQAEYEKQLRKLVERAGVSEQVTFLGRVPASAMPKLLRLFDVLLVPSIWPEPFARSVLEGMLSGLVVVATPTGGTPEIVWNGENGLLFAPGDARDLAEALARLAADPALRARLAQAGRLTVRVKFTAAKMIDKIEAYLQEVAAAAEPAPARLEAEA
ncbi:MAG: glycosyltransferase family 4 protein [Candidatus Promineifilaceae bacterium]